MPRRLQSVLAIAAGFVLFEVLTLGTGMVLEAMVHAAFPKVHPYHSALLRWLPGTGVVQNFGFMALSSYLTARLAPRRPLRHAIELGAVVLTVWVIPSVWLWYRVPWILHGAFLRYVLIDLTCILPAAWLGGTLRERQLLPA